MEKDETDSLMTFLMLCDCVMPAVWYGYGKLALRIIPQNTRDLDQRPDRPAEVEHVPGTVV